MPPSSARGTRIRQLWQLTGWGLVLLVIYLSVTPAPITAATALGDKLGHMLAYAVLMYWFASLYEAPGRRAALAVGLITMGIALEFVQHWTGYRLFEVADMAAGAAGVVAGWIVAPPRTPNGLRLIQKHC
jgi:VanZ family protein